MRGDLLADVVAAVVEGCDEVGAGDGVGGVGLDEEGEGAVFDGVLYDCGGVLGGVGAVRR